MVKSKLYFKNYIDSAVKEGEWYVQTPSKELIKNILYIPYTLDHTHVKSLLSVYKNPAIFITPETLLDTVLSCPVLLYKRLAIKYINSIEEILDEFLKEYQEFTDYINKTCNLCSIEIRIRRSPMDEN